MTSPDLLADRYGRPQPWRRRALIAVCVTVGLVFVGWLGWTIWDELHPDVSSSLVTWKTLDEHTAKAVVEVRLADEAVDPTCTVQAIAEDQHTLVGEVTFTPQDGRNELRIRTTQRATQIKLLGCTSADQNRPR